MEGLGAAGAVLGLAQQSFSLLDRIQKTLEHRKEFSIHLNTVMRDVKGTSAIIKRIEENPLLHTDDIAACIQELLQISVHLDTFVTTQDEQTKKDKGFRLFVHDFMKGPKDQKTLETHRQTLVASKNTLTLAIVASLSPSGNLISVSETDLEDRAYMHNILRKEDQSDNASTQIVIRKVQMKGSSSMLSTTLNPAQIDKLTNDNNDRMKMEIKGANFQKNLKELRDLLKTPAEEVSPELKETIIKTMAELIVKDNE